mmetsp:Transcript_174120/g.558300  ORF Transcript_174120/g.558300 Transcript_174120/m.558300 type:complete len:235 (+) Transcript_174120:56-760(+)
MYKSVRFPSKSSSVVRMCGERPCKYSTKSSYVRTLAPPGSRRLGNSVAYTQHGTTAKGLRRARAMAIAGSAAWSGCSATTKLQPRISSSARVAESTARPSPCPPSSCSTPPSPSPMPSSLGAAARAPSSRATPSHGSGGGSGGADGGGGCPGTSSSSSACSTSPSSCNPFRVQRSARAARPPLAKTSSPSLSPAPEAQASTGKSNNNLRCQGASAACAGSWLQCRYLWKMGFLQ